jgi:ribosomal protein S18 acetylase RimI-like enzyme
MVSLIAPVEAFIPATSDYAKRKAKHLRSHFPELTLGHAQQITARAMGHADWHALEQGVSQRLTPSKLNGISSVQPAFDRVQLQMSVLCEAPELSKSPRTDFSVLEFLEAWQLTGPFPSAEKDPFLGLFAMSVLNRHMELEDLKQRKQEDSGARIDPVARVSGKELEVAVRKQFGATEPRGQSLPVLQHAIRALLSEQVQLPWNRSAHTSAEADGRDWPALESVLLREFLRREAEEGARSQADVLEAYIEGDFDFARGLETVARKLVGDKASGGVVRRVAEQAKEHALHYFREACVHKCGQKNLSELLYDAALFSVFREPHPYQPDWDWEALRNEVDTEAEDDDEDFYEREYESANEEVDTEDTPYLREIAGPAGTTILAHIAPGRKGVYDSVAYELLIQEPGGAYVGILEARKFTLSEQYLGADFFPGKDDLTFAADLIDTNSWQMVDDLEQDRGEELLDELLHLTHITYLEVSPSWRRKGYGGALLDSLFALGEGGHVCIDVYPQGFPYVHLDRVSKEIRDRHQEAVRALTRYFRNRAKACPSGRWDGSLFARDVLRFASRRDGTLRHIV